MTGQQFHWNKAARRILSGSSLSDASRMSESYSAHVISSIFSRIAAPVNVLKTESEIQYLARSKKTDYLLGLESPVNGVEKMAVEVKRISDFNGHVNVDENYVFNLLNKANEGSIESNSMVHPIDRWHTQILHVITNIGAVPLFVDRWRDTVSTSGFSWIFVTVVRGQYNFIF
jgi:hypothetical protein